MFLLFKSESKSIFLNSVQELKISSLSDDSKMEETYLWDPDVEVEAILGRSQAIQIRLRTGGTELISHKAPIERSQFLR